MLKTRTRAQATASASHIGLVVRDMDEAQKMLKTLFGIGPWWNVVAEVGKDKIILGDAFKVKASQARLIANTMVELIEPMGPSTWSEFLTKRGGGVHHICYEVSNWRQMVGTVEKLGGEMLVGAKVFGKRFCYMRLPTGLIIEFADEHIHDDPQKLLRRQSLPAVSLDGGHIGTVVKNSQQAREFYKILGYNTWWIGDVALQPEAMIVGNAFSVRVSDTLLSGKTILEVLEPTSSGSLLDKFSRAGGGLHHIGFEVPAWEAMIKKIEGVGGKMIFGAAVWGKTAYMQLPIGLIVEIQTIPSHADPQKMFGIIE